MYVPFFVPCLKVPSTPEVMSTCLLSDYVALWLEFPCLHPATARW